MSNCYIIGIDIGSLSTKVALIKDGKFMDSLIDRSTYKFKEVGNQLYQKILEKNSILEDQIYKIVSTGYGRHSIDIAEKQITEITAHARGAQYYFPDACSVIDIGGQDSKAILISKKTGKVLDFQMNDKCAAGTGRFLEVMASALEVDISEFGDLALQSEEPEEISSMCTVFAESEVISLFAQGAKKEDIAAGIHQSIAKRVGGMAKRIGAQPLLVFCGGVAKNAGVKKALEDELGFSIERPPDPQITGALGAALKVYDKYKKTQN
ncbi:MAG: 2-hydroxyglutaryl-CoA dehydratase [Candidatus Lokiarchaeota archaeon]|nr:2-hydroxyglutaryl-CoA dehydratase [Candidatus Lokiarchaeota archaeon]